MQDRDDTLKASNPKPNTGGRIGSVRVWGVGLLDPNLIPLCCEVEK